MPSSAGKNQDWVAVHVNATDASRPCKTFFFFNDTATIESYTLSLHDALPIQGGSPQGLLRLPALTDRVIGDELRLGLLDLHQPPRSEEHTSELQSHVNLV